MGINVDKAYEIDKDGLVSTDEDGKPNFYLTGGLGSPIGTSSVLPTIYVQDNGDVWKNFGTGVNDWSVFGDSEKNFSICRVDELLKIPSGQEMLSRGLEVTETGGLCITEDSGVSIIRGDL